ncbi:MAG TPA: cytidylate kinase-like family protein [Polyangiales bacterium]|nr:cytidylate kinase-like family protein [Polyangiales bacterium]
MVEAARGDAVEAFPRIVTVSREFGAGGARIAGRIAAEMGFQLWDQELVSHVARKAELDTHVVRDVDERGRDLLEEVLASSLPGQMSSSKYRSLLTRTVTDLADRGGAVIVGRGANFLVPNEKALRVRIVCPLKKRIDRYAAASHLDAEAAERFVTGKDKEREKFVHQLCGESSADALHYDLVVNTADLSEQAAAQLVIATYHARFGALGRVARASSVPPQISL